MSVTSDFFVCDLAEAQALDPSSPKFAPLMVNGGRFDGIAVTSILGLHVDLIRAAIEDRKWDIKEWEMEIIWPSKPAGELPVTCPRNFGPTIS
jgi:hypothetical protein